MQNKVSYGERGKIGLIYPNTGWVMEPEFFAMAPAGVNIITTRIKLGEVTVDNIKRLSESVEYAAELLDEAQADVIVLGCTSGSFICGVGYDQEIIEKIRSKSQPNVRATTTATAVLHAIHAFGVSKIAVGTPYINEVNQCARKFLEAHEIAITKFIGLGLSDDKDINSLTRNEIKQLIRDVNTSDADMVVLLCTSIKGVDILEEMEQELGKPVITAIQATFWDCLNLMGIKKEVRGFGSLFWH